MQQYVWHVCQIYQTYSPLQILDLPKREKINFRLFSIVAALSEKVTQMEYVHLINSAFKIVCDPCLVLPVDLPFYLWCLYVCPGPLSQSSVGYGTMFRWYPCLTVHLSVCPVGCCATLCLYFDMIKTKSVRGILTEHLCFNFLPACLYTCTCSSFTFIICFVIGIWHLLCSI